MASGLDAGLVRRLGSGADQGAAMNDDLITRIRKALCPGYSYVSIGQCVDAKTCGCIDGEALGALEAAQREAEGWHAAQQSEQGIRLAKEDELEAALKRIAELERARVPREPTQAMLEAALAAVPTWEPWPSWTWRAMYDAALADPKSESNNG